MGAGRLTTTTAWRFWDWDPSNDRDFIGLPVTTVSAGTSKQSQWTQEIRYAGNISPQANFVVGAFYFDQGIDSQPGHQAGTGIRGVRFLLAPSAAASTPGLLDGYGFNQYLNYDNTSAALYGQAEWSITDRLRVLPGLRLNYDAKKVDFDQQIYGGLQTTDPALIALQRSVLAPQAYATDVDDTNVSGQATVAYRLATSVNSYATYATSFKSVGLNLNGVPTDALGRPVLSSATVKPEDVHHIEVGIKTVPFRGVTANVAVYDTEIKDFQAQVVNADVGILRGYLANAEKVRVRGAEFDGSASFGRRLSLYAAAAFTDGKSSLVSRCPSAPRRDRRSAGEGHLGIGAAGNFEDSPVVWRRVGDTLDVLRTRWPGVHGLRHELSVVVLVERDRVGLPLRRRVLAGQRPGRIPCRRRMDGLAVVAQSLQHGVLRSPVGCSG